MRMNCKLLFLVSVFSLIKSNISRQINSYELSEGEAEPGHFLNNKEYNSRDLFESALLEELRETESRVLSTEDVVETKDEVETEGEGEVEFGFEVFRIDDADKAEDKIKEKSESDNDDDDDDDDEDDDDDDDEDDKNKAKKIKNEEKDKKKHGERQGKIRKSKKMKKACCCKHKNKSKSSIEENEYQQITEKTEKHMFTKSNMKKQDSKDFQIHIKLDISDCAATSLPTKLRKSVEKIVKKVLKKAVKKGYDKNINIEIHNSVIQKSAEHLPESNTVEADLLVVAKNELDGLKSEFSNIENQPDSEDVLVSVPV